jgi:phosphatidate cytidylyltransferase
MARGQRELVALAAIPLLAATVVFLPKWVFLVVLGAAAALACDELLVMARGIGLAGGRWVPILLLVGLLAGSWSSGVSGFAVAAIAVVVVLPTIRIAHPGAPSGSLGAVAAELLAVLYLGGTAACLGWLFQWPEEPQGAKLLAFFLFSIWVGDSGAYYVGRRFGRHKMAPRISPNKTLEGLAAGVLATCAAATLGASVLRLGIAPGHVAVLAFLLAFAAPVGDLVESMFKRDSGVKDSSTLLPGHGGLLDRTDSLFYAAPFVVAYLKVMHLI